jgi:hypothetical protein
MTAGSHVWFYTNATATGAFAWVGFASVAGLAPGASAWYLLNYTVPLATPVGTKSYYAQVWFNSTYPQSPLTGPQHCTVAGVQTAVVDLLYPVRNAYPGGVVQLWALVRNTGTNPLVGDARVWFWTSTTGADVGSTVVTGLGAGQSRWYLFNWLVPATAAPNIATYWAQVRVSGAPISPWKGPQSFRIGFNYQFSSAADAAAWPPVAGVWSLVSNAWLYSVGLPNTSVSVRHPAATRYLDYEVRVWRYGCMGCANRIMIRGVPTPLGATNWWNSHFVFQFAGDGQFSVYKTVGGVLTAIQNWAPTPAIIQGPAYNTLRVVSNGDFLQYYINNQLVWQGYDASLPVANQVGVGFFNDNSLGNSFYIDSARGIPTALTLESAEGAPAMSTDQVSEAQLRLNEEANANPRGTIDQSPRRR